MSERNPEGLDVSGHTPEELEWLEKFSHEHDWEQQADEYGSLASGGSYEVYRCRVCGERSYSQMAD